MQNPSGIGGKREAINTNGVNEPSEFIPDNRPVTPQQPNEGRIIVNGTGKTENQQARNLFQIIKDVITPKKDEKK